MPLPIGPTVGILTDNLKTRASVLPLPEAAATRWARGLDLPREGDTVLYTGSMYQLIPYIAAMGRTQERLADSPLAGLAGLGRLANRVVNISSFMARPGAEARASYDRYLRNIARLLQRAGVRFGYLYGEELYSGALAYDLGADEAVAAHGRKIADLLHRHGVKRVITVDPHTTHMFRSVLPEMVPGFNPEVESYLEVLARADLRPEQKLDREVTLHDSCLYARSLDLTEQPRHLLARAGLSVKEPGYSGKFTWCCGGPVESLYPKKALEGARKRVAGLGEASDRVVTMCPLCLVNLDRAAPPDLEVRDISDYLAEAYTPDERTAVKARPSEIRQGAVCRCRRSADFSGLDTISPH